jgi:hypothetical protein
VKKNYKGINSLTKEDDNSAVDCSNVSLSVDSDDSDEQYSVDNFSEEILGYAKTC